MKLPVIGTSCIGVDIIHGKFHHIPISSQSEAQTAIYPDRKHNINMSTFPTKSGVHKQNQNLKILTDYDGTSAMILIVDVSHTQHQQ